MWNLKNNNKQLTDNKNKLVTAKGRGGSWTKRAKGIKGTKLVITKIRHGDVMYKSVTIQKKLTCVIQGSTVQMANKHMKQSSTSFVICCSVAKSCPILWDFRDCSTPGLPVFHHLPELAPTHVHGVTDAIQPFHPLLYPSPPAFNHYQY